MCGIAGFTQVQDARDVEGLCRSLDQVLKHRGPDDQGWLFQTDSAIFCQKEIRKDIAPRLALLHRRLSIIDLSSGGWQPMATTDGRFSLIFNGEIYNYLELKKELLALGVVFRSNSDTEVLLNCFARWGANCLTRLVGMFSFVVLDKARETLFLARDFFGIKPLYYAVWSRGLAFASEIKALFVLPGITRRVNAPRFHAYMTQGQCDGGSETFFESIRQIPAGHFLEVKLSAESWPQPQAYWNPSINQTLDLSFSEAANRLRELFVESVSLHLRSDVPLGACLSGGIDSSSIVHAIRYLGGPKLDLHTFTYVDTEVTVGEEPWADLVNQQARTTPHKIRLSPRNLQSDIAHLISVQDEPFVSTSIYAQYAVFRAAKEAGITVMLDGQGADEILAGYPPFIGSRIASLIVDRKLKQAWRMLASSSRLPGLAWSYLVSHVATALFPSSANSAAARFIRRDGRRRCLNDAWFQNGQPPRTEPITDSDPQMLKWALQRSLTAGSLPSLLRYEDRNSMAFSIESRVPFLTPAIVNFVYQLPEEFIIGPDGTTKHVFRTAMRGLVPDAILDRRDKIGFATAENVWIRELAPWVESVLSSETARSIPAINSRQMLEVFRNYHSQPTRIRNSLWRWVNAIEWSHHSQVAYNP